MSKMRYPTPDVSNELNMRFSGKKLESILSQLKLPRKRQASVWRAMKGEPGVSFEMENEIRDALGMKLLPPEVDEYDPRTHRVIRQTGTAQRKKYYRPCLDADLRDHFTSAEINQHLRALVNGKRRLLEALNDDPAELASQ